MAELEFIFRSDSRTHSCLACDTATKNHEKVRLETNKIIVVGRFKSKFSTRMGKFIIGANSSLFCLKFEPYKRAVPMSSRKV